MVFDGFEWDAGNKVKCQKHGVLIDEIQAVLSGNPIVREDPLHSAQESRFRAIGRNHEGRTVFIVFTFRHSGNMVFVRPISARYMHSKELRSYERD
nr:BrnT family toxin [Jiella avicenniae]